MYISISIYIYLTVCKEALEVLTIALALNSAAFEVLLRDKMWHMFLIDLVLLSTSRAIRIVAAEQFFLVSTWCRSGNPPVLFTISLLFTVLNTTVMENSKQCHEYFQVIMVFFMVFYRLCLYNKVHFYKYVLHISALM